MAGGPPIETTRLSKTYDKTVDALVDLDLRVDAGEVFGYLGPNGAGKSTTIRLLLGLIRPTGGTATSFGIDTWRRSVEAHRRLGYLPGDLRLSDKLTGEEQLESLARLRGGVDQRLRSELCERLGVVLDRPIRQLSKGNRQKLGIVQAFMHRPDVVVLDEPTTGLDPQARHLIWERLRRLLAQGKTIFLTTHFMDEAERLCHRLAIMDRGRIIAQGAPRELIARHIEPQVVEVYGDGAERWAREFGRARAERCEQAGETVFCYTRDAGPLVQDLDRQPDLRYLHRHANLEDVFLKLTGRELRD